MKFSEVVDRFGNPAHWGAADLEVTGVNSIEDATPGQISYIGSEKFVPMIATTGATVLLLPKHEQLQAFVTSQGIAWIEVPEPRLGFAQAIDIFYKPYQPPVRIHPTAVIDPTAKIGNNAAIAAHVVIEANVVIGDDARIHPNVVVYPGVIIGDRVTLHANCTIQERSQLGNDCIVNSGAVIGGEGFGYVPTAEGWYPMRQSGYVILEDKVEIGCNSTIDRPAVGVTRIGRDTKLDNLVHIGHGSTIGSGCALAAQVGLAGGVTLGNGVILGGQVGVANNGRIGDRAMASSKTGINSVVPAGKVVSGSPAIDHRIYLKVSAIYARIPDLYQDVRRMKKSMKKAGLLDDSDMK
jgi:UDP-3-O-[3-hydroxymyristoyl] glucosamine N-acyltransferase